MRAGLTARAVAVVTAAAVATALPPIGSRPAAAGIGRKVIASCPSGPQECWPTAFAFTPNGAAFCDDCNLGTAADRDLFVGSWNDGNIRRLVLSDDRKHVLEEHVVYDQEAGILAVEAAPDGRLYFSDPSGIYRLVP